MSKSRITVDDISLELAGVVLRSSEQTTEQLGELLLPQLPLLGKVFTSRTRTLERLEVLKLHYDIVIPHIAVAEYNLEHNDYWNRDNAEIASLLRKLSFQAIEGVFDEAGCGVIDANLFVRDTTERFTVYAATTRLTNIAEEIAVDHQLPSRMRADELLRFLGPARISTYKELWAEDQERQAEFQRPSTGDLLAAIYRHWRGDFPSRSMDTLQFNLILESSLVSLNLVLLSGCYAIKIDGNS